MFVIIALLALLRFANVSQNVSQHLLPNLWERSLVGLQLDREYWPCLEHQHHLLMSLHDAAECLGLIFVLWWRSTWLLSGLLSQSECNTCKCTQNPLELIQKYTCLKIWCRSTFENSTSIGINLTKATVSLGGFGYYKGSCTTCSKRLISVSIYVYTRGTIITNL